MAALAIDTTMNGEAWKSRAVSRRLNLHQLLLQRCVKTETYKRKRQKLKLEK